MEKMIEIDMNNIESGEDLKRQIEAALPDDLPPEVREMVVEHIGMMVVERMVDDLIENTPAPGPEKFDHTLINSLSYQMSDDEAVQYVQANPLQHIAETNDARLVAHKLTGAWARISRNHLMLDDAAAQSRVKELIEGGYIPGVSH